MPFYLIGGALLILAILFLRAAVKDKDSEGVVGVTALLIAALILIVFFGIIYTSFYK